MTSLIKGILAVALSAIGLQVIAEKLDFSNAVAGPMDPESTPIGNRDF